MPRRRLSELLEPLGLTVDSAGRSIEVRGIAMDSRTTRPGDLFVAIPGLVTDGLDYVDDAIARGAVAVIAERKVPCGVPLIRTVDARAELARLAAAFHGHPTRGLFTVGVTGTNGKTTVCHLVHHLLGASDGALISTVENEHRGLHAVTTPESPVIQEVAADALAGQKHHLVIEVSSAALPLHRVDAVDFDVAVFTNLTHDHLDFHADREAYLHAKLLLFEGLKSEGTAIVNLDDPAAPRVIGACRGRPLTFGLRRDADITATDIHATLRETRFRLTVAGKQRWVNLRLPGEHNVSNALAAAGVALVAGAGIDRIAPCLGEAESVEGRYQFLRTGAGATLIVDFAHSPDSLERMLRSLRPHFERLLCVFGCGGESDRAKRPLMGAISGRLADLSILTSDNPKSEDPQEIIETIAAGLRPTGGAYEVIVDRRDAIRHAVALAGPRDVVLLAGKGHEPYQIVGHNFVPYSDVRFLREEGLAQ
jgi:UDP-N-acetylmuramoyl-L-alanyl-D-glutamate--2,6-diaminopimelate ligase